MSGWEIALAAFILAYVACMVMLAWLGRPTNERDRDD